KRRRRALHGLGDLQLARAGQTRGRDVNGFLEVGAVERIGLVEQRQRRQCAVDEQALQGHFETRNELLDQDLAGAGIVRLELRCRKDRSDLVERVQELV